MFIWSPECLLTTSDSDILYYINIIISYLYHQSFEQVSHFYVRATHPIHIQSVLSYLPHCFLRRLGSWEALWLRERQYVTLEHMSTLGANWETDGGAVQQERLDAWTVGDRSVSRCHLTVRFRHAETNTQINTYRKHTNKQGATNADTLRQLQHHTGYYCFKSLWSSADGAVLSRDSGHMSPETTWTRVNLAPVCTFYICACLSKLKWFQYMILYNYQHLI